MLFFQSLPFNCVSTRKKKKAICKNVKVSQGSSLYGKLSLLLHPPAPAAQQCSQCLWKTVHSEHIAFHNLPRKEAIIIQGEKRIALGPSPPTPSVRLFHLQQMHQGINYMQQYQYLGPMTLEQIPLCSDPPPTLTETNVGQKHKSEFF